MSVYTGEAPYAPKCARYKDDATKRSGYVTADQEGDEFFIYRKWDEWFADDADSEMVLGFELTRRDVLTEIAHMRHRK